MSKQKPNQLIYDTTIPYLDFNFKKFSNKATIKGYLFASSLEDLDRFLFFQRWVYHIFEPNKKWAIKEFLSQINRESKAEWKERLSQTFDWEEQEKVISELVLPRIVNRYTIYIRDMADQVIHLTKPAEDVERKYDLSNYPKIKKFYKEHLGIPLYLTANEENLAGQIMTIRNLIVHNFNYIPDNYVAKFYNWKELECIKQDDDIFYIELAFSSLDKLGNFLSKSVADIDNRISEKYNIEQYYFDEEDVPAEEKSDYETTDEEYADEDEEL